jgi:cytochrome oxidase assembly protein ShyY1
MMRSPQVALPVVGPNLWTTRARAGRLWTPRALGLHALLLAALVACAFLGQWQYGRFSSQQRGPVLQRPDPPVAVETLLRPATTLPESAPGRAVTAKGHFVPRSQLLLPGRETADGRRGYWLLAPLQVDGGATLAVVRGWVPSPDAAAVSPPSGEITVTGRVQPAEPVDAATDTSLPKGQAGAASAVELLDTAPGPFYPGLLVAQSVSPSSAPQPASVQLWAHAGGGTAGLRNLAYALQWWLFAGFAIFLWWRALALTERPPDGVEAPSPALDQPLETTP